ncbi:MAG: TIGR02147 family protein [Bdellovibrionales bacterium]
MGLKKFKEIDKPTIYQFHDYRDFLKVWLEYRVSIAEKFSIRRLSKLAGISVGYIPMVLKGERNLSEKALNKILPFLELSSSEASYLKNLIVLADSNSQDERLEVLRKMQKSTSYSEKNSGEVRAYKFLTKWYNVAIREMVSLKSFVGDVDWIKQRLIPRVYKKEIRESLDFLSRNEFIKAGEDEFFQNEKNLNCVGPVFKVGLTQFHKEMFQLAAQSIDDTPSEWRSIVGHTLAVSKKQFLEIKEILDEALNKISQIENKKETNEVVFHTALIAFPLTKIEDEVQNEKMD